jgi:hypothetical protein
MDQRTLGRLTVVDRVAPPLTVFHRMTTCPHCGIVELHHENISVPGEPVAGDVSMCMNCGGWAVFEHVGATAKLVLRKPTLTEDAAIHRNSEFTAAHRGWVLSMRKLGRKVVV